MKKIIFFIILLVFASNVYAHSLKDFEKNIDYGIGFSNSDVHLYGTSLNLKGPALISTIENNLKENENTSLMLEYIFSYVALTSSDFPVNDDMLGQNLNDIFTTQFMLESFFGVRSYFPINSMSKLYGDYGLHTNMINLECSELLWLLLNTGFYCDVGIKTKINEKVNINIGYKVSADFFSLPINDLYYTEDVLQRIDLKSPFWGTNSILFATISFNY